MTSQLARQSLHELKVSRNRYRALELAKQAVREDPEESDAWKALGLAAGWTSHSDHAGEMIDALDTAIRLAPADSRASLSKELATEVANIVDFHGKVDLMVIGEMRNPESQRDIEFIERFAETARGMIRSLERSYEWAGMRETLDKIVALATILIRGFSFNETSYRGESTFKLQTELEQELLAVIDRTASEIRSNFDSAYVTPSPQDEQPVKHVGCFVVTATMGSETAYPVRVLRNYRDDVLVHHQSGRKFVDWYYRRGPGIAAIVERSVVLRAFAFVFVVAPATAVAKLATRAAPDAHRSHDAVATRAAGGNSQERSPSARLTAE